ncbi:signal peptidase II [Bacillaceae bacterium S4-13-58]
MLYYLLSLVVIFIDQITKYMVSTRMDQGDSIEVISSFFYITSHRNPGAAWGILKDQMVFFYIITIIVVVFVIYFIQKYGKTNRLYAVALSLILGGAIGNFIDRLLWKEVIDFFDFYIFNYDYPIFNIADSSLVVGVILVLIATWKDEKKKGV